MKKLEERVISLFYKIKKHRVSNANAKCVQSKEILMNTEEDFNSFVASKV
jgi:hypothetical protein